MKIRINDVIKINQGLFDFLYKFQRGESCTGSDFYVLQKITDKYYHFKEADVSYGLRYTKTLKKIEVPYMDEMSEKYGDHIEVLQGQERTKALESVLEGQIWLDNIHKASTANQEYLKALIAETT